MRRLCLLVIGLFSFAVACQRQAAVDTRAADERAIRTADAACLRAAQAKDTEGVLSCYAAEASWLPPNAPPLTGKEALRAGWSQLLASPGFAISWQITKLQVSRSGDLAYALYSYELTTQGPDAVPITDRGKDMAVWNKQPDGSWRIVADAYSSDQPATSAKPPAAKKKIKRTAGRHRHVRRR
ncbi:MAG TPA: SgcJ/EcaC family oxidoreductase [Candidatus Acidoferrales bacterium]|nr:SgcJ/EcaC family oxidoreductase [Candidatus Acidoferrales bacterium]